MIDFATIDVKKGAKLYDKAGIFNPFAQGCKNPER